jgi:rhomboid family GlyGly-CTERM serine protease
MIGKLPLAELAARRLPVASLLFVVLAAALYALPGSADWLQYDRTAILHGEVWRLLTGHLVHWSGNQLFWDGLALGFLGWLCERVSVASFLRCFVLSAFSISLTLWFAAPWMATYRGLSGIDSALFALVAVRLAREAFVDRQWFKLGLVGIVAGGFVLKLGYEFASGSTLFVDSSAGGMTPVPLAHVVGALVGIACGLMPILAGRSRPSIAKWWNDSAVATPLPSRGTLR